MRPFILAPVWVELNVEEQENSVSITHSIKIGFNGVARFMDILFRMFFNEQLEENLDKDVKQEFKLLAKKLPSAA